MPIVFIHGVAIRDDSQADLPRRYGKVPWAEVEARLRAHVAPAISADPAGVPILRMYWGDLGATLAWGDRFRVSPGQEARHPAKVDLRPLSGEELGQRLEHEVLGRTPDTSQWPGLIEAIWAVARHPDTSATLQSCATATEADDFLSDAIEGARASLRRSGQGADGREGPRWWESLGKQIKPAGDRVLARQRANIIAVLNRIRSPLENYVPIFMGDLLAYLRLRGDALHPGPIPARTLSVLAEARQLQLDRGGEPLVVLSHSMGGQIIYDVISHFLPRMPQYREVRIDFWCSCGSQVGLFEELKLFLESSPAYGAGRIELVPRPDERHLGYWWNVWDYADLMSFRAEGIIDGVDDMGLLLGRAIQQNHSAYLDSDDFYKMMAAKIKVHLPGLDLPQPGYQPRARQVGS
ncbi:hypothetical protein GCM10009841_16740 [Microlunatus panaciterrae]|uniref:Alpha/beta hydrolase n=1 Tax=Microlunatus panaciterrae TaxID=400768 RepID=A0ABS2RMK5_9ACTN|nr:hypothetical protein [Microlunatus panaciterrae]MBM7800234.1 hypothetical protein [Microlunatus panaciterrae]